MNAIQIILLVASSAVAAPIVVLAAEVAAACLARSPGPLACAPQRSAGTRLAVLIPAHNEEGGIAQTIASIQSQLMADDRLVVVADNCTDNTASTARTLGAEVVERFSETQRGKGFALAAGVQHLWAAPPEVVIIIDADTPPDAGSLCSLAAEANRWQTSIQAIYLMTPPAGASPKDRVSAFAFCLKNRVRPQGAQRLGIPCQLTGTGMAFPWSVISQAKLATGNIVEDMQLGMDLAIAGYAPRFCPTAQVLGTLPESTSAAAAQRTRWEHGHLQTILHNVPPLLWAGLRQGRPSLIGLALDLAVPPLALLVCLWLALLTVVVASVLLGLASAAPLMVVVAQGLMLALSVLTGWAFFARQLLPLATLLTVPAYILWKVPLYLAFPFRRQKVWVRTARS